MEAPFGQPCTMEGQVCVYENGHTECTCMVADGWTCMVHRGN
jgi:hypothetical protein